MNRAKACVAPIMSALSILTAGCDRNDLSGPPVLRAGRDECAECGMMINDERASSALLVLRDGRREHLIFDDIGCMLDYERPGANEIRVLDRFVHDRASGAWVAGSSAWYLLTDPRNLATPMGSGIGAFANRAEADLVQARLQGAVLDYAKLAEARSEAAHNRRRSGEPE